MGDLEAGSGEQVETRELARECHVVFFLSQVRAWLRIHFSPFTSAGFWVIEFRRPWRLQQLADDFAVDLRRDEPDVGMGL